LSHPRYKDLTKRLLGWFPALARMYQRVLAAGRPPADGYSLDELSGHLPSWVETVSSYPSIEIGGGSKNFFVFGYLRWWLEYGIALSLLL
jgi:hypothetical protein